MVLEALIVWMNWWSHLSLFGTGSVASVVLQFDVYGVDVCQKERNIGVCGKRMGKRWFVTQGLSHQCRKVYLFGMK